MVTPGAAGGMLMLIVNAICFSFPEIEPRYCALVLSFVLGTLVFKATALKLGERAMYWVINSLIIFAMGMGTANLASNASVQALETDSGSARSVFELIIPEAYADTSNPSIDSDNSEIISTRQNDEIERLKKENAKLKSLIDQRSEKSSASTIEREEELQRPKRRFFGGW